MTREPSSQLGPQYHLPPGRRATYAALVLERYTRADGKHEKAVRRALAEFVDRLDRYDNYKETA